jgi:hypothetical protein
MNGSPKQNLQCFTVFGGINGTQYTVPFGYGQLCGQLKYSFSYEILGYHAQVIGGYDFLNLPILPPVGILTYGAGQPAYQFSPAFTQGPALNNIIVALQASNAYVPNTAYVGATNRVIGTANASHTFQPGFSLLIPQGTPVSVYVRLAGFNITDDLTMQATLYVNVLGPNS